MEIVGLQNQLVTDTSPDVLGSFRKMRLGGIETKRKNNKENKKNVLVAAVNCYTLNCLAAPLANLQFCGLQQLQ